MDTLDDVTIETLKAANVGEDLLRSLSRDDIRDLFPGPENFLRRRALWLSVHRDEMVENAATAVRPSNAFANTANAPPEEHQNTSKYLTMTSPEYILYTDGELELARSSYFDQKRLGTTLPELSKELFCRLIRNTMTNMISIARALKEPRYPSKHEVESMAKRLVEYYPMLKDQRSDNVWRNVAKKLMKRLSNVKSPKKASIPSKRRRLTFEDTSDFDDGTSSQASTIILNKSPTTSTPESSEKSSEDEAVCSLDLLDSQKNQSRHYKTLQDMNKSKKPNKAAVTHLLNLEFEARRRFITCGLLKEPNRPTKILEAYPCFKELDHVLDEMQRIIQPKNANYLGEVRERWEDFFSKLKFYGVIKKAMQLPMTNNNVDQALAVFTALPALFPSGVSPPKKLGSCSEAFIHVLKAEDPAVYLQQRPLMSPVLLVSTENCMIAMDNTPVITFPSSKLDEGLVYLMAFYYAMHLTYPKCISTLLSVLQTEILLDSIHDRDATPMYKKAIAEWKAFIENSGRPQHFRKRGRGLGPPQRAEQDRKAKEDRDDYRTCQPLVITRDRSPGRREAQPSVTVRSGSNTNRNFSPDRDKGYPYQQAQQKHKPNMVTSHTPSTSVEGSPHSSGSSKEKPSASVAESEEVAAASMEPKLTPEEDFKARRLEAIKAKALEIEKHYRKDCETFRTVVKMLVAKEPSLDNLLQAPLDANLLEIKQHCLEALRNFMKELDEI